MQRKLVKDYKEFNFGDLARGEELRGRITMFHKPCSIFTI